MGLVMTRDTLRRWLRRLVSECLLGHAPRVWERDRHGRLLLVCPRCRDAQRVQGVLS